MNAAEIRQRLEGARSGTSLDLMRLADDIAPLRLLAEAWGDGGSLIVSRARIGWEATGRGAQLAGTLSIDETAAELRATFRPAKQGMGCDLLLELPAAQPWSIDHLPFSLEIDGLELSTAPPDYLAASFRGRATGEAGVSIPVRLDVPGPGGVWALHCWSCAEPVTLPALARMTGAADLAALLPWEFEEVGLTEFGLEYLPQDGVRSISFGVATTRSHTLLDGLEIESVSLRALVHAPFDAGQRCIDLQLCGVARIGDTELRLEAVRNSMPGAAGTWTFRGILGDLSPAHLLRLLEARFGFTAPPLPQVIPSIVFDEIEVEITPALKSFRFHAIAHGKFALADRGASIAVDRLEFDFSRRVVDGKAEYPFTIDTSLSGPGHELAPGLVLRRGRVTFSHDAGWSASGELEVDVLDHRGLKLGASYSEAQGATLEFKAADIGRLTLAEPIDAALLIDSIALRIEHKAETSDRVFSVDGDARLTVGTRIDIHARMGLAAGQDGSAALELSVTGTSPPFTLPIPGALLHEGAHPTCSLTSGTIAIRKDNAGWGVEGSVVVEFRGCPSTLPLPREPITGTLVLDSTGFKVGAGPVVELPAIELGRMPIRHVEMGSLGVGLDEVSLSARPGGDLLLSIKPFVRLPPGINDLVFGPAGSEGHAHEILVTDKGLRCELGLGWIGGSLGAQFRLLDSPLKAFPFDESGQHVPLDLGSAGRINIDVPMFSLGTSGFVAGGGFAEDRDRPLALPLQMLKEALAPKAPSIAAALPDSIPLLRRPALLKADKLDVGQLRSFLRQSFGDRLPENELADRLFDALQALADGVTGLPGRLKEYLFGDLPSDFHFSITADPTGSVTADIRSDPGGPGSAPLTSAQALDPAQGGRPIMVLFPALPQLIGLRLSNLRIGPIFGGSLILLRVNAEIDLFDPATLVASIAAAEKPELKRWLPAGTAAHCTIQLHDLVLFVVYEAAGVPIPVPVFYEKLGLDLTRPGGLALAASVSFNPLTRNGLAEVFGTLEQLYEFITTDARLDAGKGIQLDASIGPTFLRLPGFLGGGELGSENRPAAELHLAQVFAKFLNGVKFLELSEMLAGIPLEHRCGAACPRFGPISLGGAWALTTREEFTKGLAWTDPGKQHSNALVGLSRAQARSILAVLDAAPQDAAGHGLVLLLAGSGSLGSLLAIEGSFALVTAGHGGFATGTRLSGSVLAETLCFELTGCVHLDLSSSLGEGKAGFDGRARLMVNRKPSIEGAVTVSDDRIAFSCDVDLFPGSKAISIAGKLAVSLSKQDGFQATGSGSLTLFGATAAGTVELTARSFVLRTRLKVQGGMLIHLEAMGTTLAPQGQKSIALSGGVDNFSPGLMAQAAGNVQKEVNRQLREWVRWADGGYRKDQRKWWWEREHTLVNWEAQYVAYSELVKLTDGTIGGVAMAAVESAISLLPASVAQAVRAIVQKAALFEGVTVNVETNLGAAMTGRITLKLSGRYAGQVFRPILVTVPLNASTNPVASVAAELTKALLPHAR